MSKCRPKNEQMIKDIFNDIFRRFNYTWKDEVKVYYDASPYCTKRDYVLQMHVGEVWNRYDTEELRKLIRENGGTNIIGGCRKSRYSRQQFIDIAFDEKVRKKS